MLVFSQNQVNQISSRMYQSGIPPQLKLPPTLFRSIRNGNRGIVFQIACNLAAKVLYDGDCMKDTKKFSLRANGNALSKLEHECAIANHLRSYNIRVPKPIGVEKAHLFHENLIAFPVYIMQFLPYSRGGTLDRDEFSRAETLAKEEIEKAEAYGFTRGVDALDPNNFLYDRKKGEVYLIDFEFWEHKERNLFPPKS